MMTGEKQIVRKRKTTSNYTKSKETKNRCKKGKVEERNMEKGREGGVEDEK